MGEFYPVIAQREVLVALLQAVVPGGETMSIHQLYIDTLVGLGAPRVEAQQVERLPHQRHRQAGFEHHPAVFGHFRRLGRHLDHDTVLPLAQ